MPYHLTEIDHDQWLVYWQDPDKSWVIIDIAKFPTEAAARDYMANLKF